MNDERHCVPTNLIKIWSEWEHIPYERHDLREEGMQKDSNADDLRSRCYGPCIGTDQQIGWNRTHLSSDWQTGVHWRWNGQLLKAKWITLQLWSIFSSTYLHKDIQTVKFLRVIICFHWNSQIVCNFHLKHKGGKCMWINPAKWLLCQTITSKVLLGLSALNGIQTLCITILSG